jgi:hypothetical protein
MKVWETAGNQIQEIASVVLVSLNTDACNIVLVKETGSHIARKETALAEFEAARKRELGRLNVPLFSSTGKESHTSEHLALLEGDTFQQEMLDKETVRLWPNRSKQHGEEKKPL